VVCSQHPSIPTPQEADPLGPSQQGGSARPAVYPWCCCGCERHYDEVPRHEDGPDCAIAQTRVDALVPVVLGKFSGQKVAQEAADDVVYGPSGNACLRRHVSLRVVRVEPQRERVGLSLAFLCIVRLTREEVFVDRSGRAGLWRRGQGERGDGHRRLRRGERGERL